MEWSELIICSRQRFKRVKWGQFLWVMLTLKQTKNRSQICLTLLNDYDICKNLFAYKHPKKAHPNDEEKEEKTTTYIISEKDEAEKNCY